MASQEELLTARIIFRAVLPVMKVLIEDDPGFKKKFEKVKATVQVIADDGPDAPQAAYLKFDDGALEVVMGQAENPEIVLAFPSVAKMNAMFRGKPVVPKLGPMLANLRHFGVFTKVMSLLMAMKILQPDAKCKSEHWVRLKVKMTIYMITTALSQLNKFGDAEMAKWTAKQPERIYQWSVEPEGIAAWLKIKAGKSKAGRGYYERRKPFVHMKFDGAENALLVLTNGVEMVPAMAKGMLVNDGSPEYGAAIGLFMVRIGSLLS